MAGNSPSPVARAFDGSTSAFRGLEVFGWGPLLNLGYFRLWELPLLLTGLGYFQRLLARKSISLLDPKPGERVLDVGCGRGWTSHWIAARGAKVVALDLLEHHIESGRSQFGNGIEWLAGDATEILPSLEPVDRIHCLECAFEFGPEGRRAFLADAYQLLRPGGRLVLVDFTWRSDQPGEIEALDPERLVRDTWGYEEFEPLERYRATAKACGFREIAIHDWTRLVLDRFQRIAQTFINLLASSNVIRWAYRWIWPGTRRLRPEEWVWFARLMRAHDRVRSQTRYTAMVLEKPVD
jgi:cyclopropane fatty-acyl-phospholipid synthase-like methyltransferase